MGAHAEDAAFGIESQLAAHVEVAGEARGDEVLGTGLHPLHRAPDEQRGRRCYHVARIDGHLVAEAAADVRRDDADVLLGEPGHQGEQGAVGVRRLRGEVDRRLTRRRVDVGNRAACLQRRWVGPGIVGVERDHVVRLREGPVGGRLVARLPEVGAVVRLALFLVTDQRRARLHGLPGVGDGGQLLVVHEDEGEGVAGHVGVLGDHRRHLLTLVPHLVGGQHCLGVSGEGGHPGQVVRLEVLAGDHRHHAGQLGRFFGVDGEDLGVGHRAAQDRHVQHPRQHHVVDVGAGPLDEAIILLASYGMSHAADLDGSAGWVRGHRHVARLLNCPGGPSAAARRPTGSP